MSRKVNVSGLKTAPPVLNGGSRPRLRILVETPQDHSLSQRVNVFDMTRGCRRRGLVVKLDQFVNVLRFINSLAGEQFIEHEAQRVDVAALRDFFARELLGSHVRRSTRQDVFFAKLLAHYRQTEVGDARFAAAVDHHVGRLEIAMQDTHLVGGGESRADLTRDLDRLDSREVTNTPQQRSQVLAVDELHRDEMQTSELCGDFTDVIHAANIWVGHLPSDAHFIVKASEHSTIERDLLGQELECNGLIELEVFGLEDFAHPSAAEEADDSITPGEYRAGDESAFATRGRSRKRSLRVNRDSLLLGVVFSLRHPRWRSAIRQRRATRRTGEKIISH
ncbi:MAG: hypothetical protein AABO57_14155 [Acidobacteriota bacterium]